MPTAVLPPTIPAIPTQLFDANFYRAANPDLAGFSDEEALAHFEKYGVNEGRRFSPIFDFSFYRDSNSDLAKLSNRNLLIHFANYGITENRNPSPFFNFNYYKSVNQDLVDAKLTNEQLLNHYLKNGIDEGRRASQFFDVSFYRTNNPDLAQQNLSNKDLLNQYVISGTLEGRRGSLIFDPSYYLGTNQDLAVLGLNFQQALVHYASVGQSQGRQPSLFYDKEAIDALIVPEVQPTTTTDQTTQTSSQQVATRSIWDVAKGGTLTYSFVTTASSFLYPGTEAAVGEVSDAIKNNVRQIMQKYSQILPFNLVEVPDRPPSIGQIRIMFSNGDNGSNFYAYGYLPGDGVGGDIHLSRNYETDPNLGFSKGVGTYGYETLVHEIGHALGLKHPNNYTGASLNDASSNSTDLIGPYLSFSKDNNTNTVMSYNDVGAGASGPMAYDVRALQFLYGSSDFNTGNSVYTFDSSSFFNVKQTLWDSGGFDLLDFSKLPGSESYYFDMNEGGRLTTTGSINGITYQAYGDTSGRTYTADSYATVIAYGATIEMLAGTPGNDIVLGNNVGNMIFGNAGADKITGGKGADILTGGPGVDTFVYSRGDGGSTVAGGDTITDFVVGQDKIGLSSGLSLNKLLITAQGSDTLIQVGDSGEYLARLTGIQPLMLSASDFILV